MGTLSERQWFAFVMTLWLPFLLLGSYFYHKRRNYHPIKGRAPGLAILSQLAVEFALLKTALTDAIYTPSECTNLMIVTSVSDRLTGYFYVTRVWDLFFRYQITKVFYFLNSIYEIIKN